MVKDRQHYTLLSELFKYPEKDYISKLDLVQKYLDEFYPIAGNELKVFSEYIHTRTLDERQELFTKTFDVQPICYLDLGYVMFGEDYKRGAFLLSMQAEQLKIDNDCGTDLPDNICNVLTLMSKSTDEKFLEDLVWRIFIPCVHKMIAEFKSARVDLKMKVLKKMHRAIIQEELNHGNLYNHCFLALLEVLRTDFGELDLINEDNSALSSSHHQTFFNKQAALSPVTQQQTSEAQIFASLQKLD